MILLYSKLQYILESESILPFDIIKYILKDTLAATIIQKSYRRYMMRHCKHDIWPSIRYNILKNNSFSSFDKLTNENWIRREWRTEPESWIYMLKNKPYDLQEIIQNDIKKINIIV